ncbi:MAG TPA: hypothetical protein K8W13_00070 [Enterococcus columbae]|nr:hypothetical protein [Enterococcus columbae]
MAFYTQKKDATFAKAMEDYTKQAYDLMKTLFQQGRKEGLSVLNILMNSYCFIFNA